MLYALVPQHSHHGRGVAAVQDARSKLDGIIRVLESFGLVVHETEISSGKIQTLGVELDCEQLVTRVVQARRSRLRAAIRGICRRRTVTGDMLQIIIGHCTFCGLVRRPSLAIFSAVYSFIAKFGKERAGLWDTCRAELRAFAGLLPLLESSWSAPLCPWSPLKGLPTSALTVGGLARPMTHVELTLAWLLPTCRIAFTI